MGLILLAGGGLVSYVMRTARVASFAGMMGFIIVVMMLLAGMIALREGLRTIQMRRHPERCVHDWRAATGDGQPWKCPVCRTMVGGLQ